MICVVDASVAVKWFVQSDWALREDHIEPALEMLKADRSMNTCTSSSVSSVRRWWSHTNRYYLSLASTHAHAHTHTNTHTQTNKQTK